MKDPESEQALGPQAQTNSSMKMHINPHLHLPNLMDLHNPYSKLLGKKLMLVQKNGRQSQQRSSSTNVPQMFPPQGLNITSARKCGHYYLKRFGTSLP